MPLKTTLPSDLEDRMRGLGEAIAASCPDVLFVYLFGSAATGMLTRRSDVDLAVFIATGGTRVRRSSRSRVWRHDNWAPMSSMSCC